MDSRVAIVCPAAQSVVDFGLLLLRKDHKGLNGRGISRVFVCERIFFSGVDCCSISLREDILLLAKH